MFWSPSSLGYHIFQDALAYFYCKERLTRAKHFLTLWLSHPKSHILWNWCTAFGLDIRVYLPSPFRLRNEVSGSSWTICTGHHTPHPIPQVSNVKISTNLEKLDFLSWEFGIGTWTKTKLWRSYSGKQKKTFFFLLQREKIWSDTQNHRKETGEFYWFLILAKRLWLSFNHPASHHLLFSYSNSSGIVPAAEMIPLKPWALRITEVFH